MNIYRNGKFEIIRCFHTMGLILLLIVCADVFAQEEGAGQPGAFLRLGVGARALGLGRAYTAIANDASAPYWNPAGLGMVRNKEVMAMYSLLSMERRHHYLAIALPTRSFGAFGVSWINLDVGELEGRDWMGRITDSFSNAQNAYFLSWAIPLSESIHVGCTAKYITHTLENFQSLGYGVDAGVFIQMTEFISIGAVVKDISTRVKWNTSGKKEERYPMTTRLGAAFRPVDLPITIGLDVERIANRKASLHGGVEFALISGLGLRVGFDSGLLSAGGFISMPLGGTHFQTDYSFGQDPIDETYVHRVSVSLKLLPTITPSPSLDKIKPENLNGYPSLMSPPPDARVIRVLEGYPNYALINAGSQDGLTEGMIFEVYRLIRLDNQENQTKSLIGTVEVVKVEEQSAAVRVKSLIEGFLIEQGNVLVRK